MNEQNLIKFNKLFPWFAGLSGDLLFWAAIDTLFLTVVKNFNASQIVSLTSISLITCILLQIPLLNIIKKIGNTKSVRLGSLLLLISSILLTLGTNYIIVVIGKILYEVAFTFQNMINVVLKNNLELQNRENEYIKFRTSANTIYAIATMIISFVASFMFNINNYLPMIGCITFCFVCFVLSFNMVDYSNNNCIKSKIYKENKDKLKKINYSKIVLFIIISYGLFYPIVNSGQSNGKLFIQQELLKKFNVEKQKEFEHSKYFQKTLLDFFNSLILKDKNHYGYILESGQSEPQIVKEMIDFENTIIVCLGLGKLNIDEMVELCIEHDIEKDWTFGLSREYLKKHAIDWYSANEMLKKECPKYGIKYYDTSENREQVLNDIMCAIEKEI